MKNCLFCKIINQEIPSFKIYEDQNVYAFLDISATTIGHTLVVPKKHCRNLLEASSEILNQVFTATSKIATLLSEKLGAKGFNIASNINEVAGQSVFHFHVHILPRYSSNDGYSMQFKTSIASEEELMAVYKRIVD